jgi:hypothetical protein
MGLTTKHAKALDDISSLLKQRQESHIDQNTSQREDLSYQESLFIHEEDLPEAFLSNPGSPLVKKRKKHGRKGHKAS